MSNPLQLPGRLRVRVGAKPQQAITGTCQAILPLGATCTKPSDGVESVRRWWHRELSARNQHLRDRSTGWRDVRSGRRSLRRLVVQQQHEEMHSEEGRQFALLIQRGVCASLLHERQLRRVLQGSRLR